MKTRFILPAVALLMSSAFVSAHTGATGVTLERMEGMTAMADAMKVLTPVLRGQPAYDAEIVAQAGLDLAQLSGNGLITLFADEATAVRPSEAGPAIWSDPEGFAQLAMDLERLGGELSAAAASQDAAKVVYGEIAKTCVACHEDYRVDRD